LSLIGRYRREQSGLVIESNHSGVNIVRQPPDKVFSSAYGFTQWTAGCIAHAAGMIYDEKHVMIVSQLHFRRRHQPEFDFDFRSDTEDAPSHATAIVITSLARIARKQDQACTDPESQQYQ
jgi:hypothetical protein